MVTTDAVRILSSFDVIELDCCTDCLLIMANGENSDEDGGTARAQRIAARHGDDVPHMSPACSTDEDGDHTACEGWHDFTCGVCGDDTQGEQHRAVILRSFPVIDIDDVVDHYLGCALWSSHDCVDGDDVLLDENHDRDDVAPDVVAQAREDVIDFVELIGARDMTEYLRRQDAEQLGHDLWLTRNGHGAGFWDRGLGDLGRRMSKWAHAAGSVDLYVGDDGLIYSM